MMALVNLACTPMGLVLKAKFFPTVMRVSSLRFQHLPNLPLKWSQHLSVDPSPTQAIRVRIGYDKTVDRLILSVYPQGIPTGLQHKFSFIEESDRQVFDEVNRVDLLIRMVRLLRSPFEIPCPSR